MSEAADWTIAIGTVAAALATSSAVIVALWQSRGQQRVTGSQIYFEEAKKALEAAVSDFAQRKDSNGRPINDRQHWLNFARAIGTTQKLSSEIQTIELREVWAETEHYWRSRVYDLLTPLWESFPANYYGYVDPSELHKNIAQAPGEWSPLAEASLVVVYRWIVWPQDRPDTLDRTMRFSDEEIGKMESFGPRGLGEYITILRNLRSKAKSQSANNASSTQ
jgi:hypothetical protein